MFELFKYLLVSSADNFWTVWTQIRPDKTSGQIWVQTIQDTLKVYMKDFSERLILTKKNQHTAKKACQNSQHAKGPVEVSGLAYLPTNAWYNI